jgi:hypothetical protein
MPALHHEPLPPAPSAAADVIVERPIAKLRP